MINPIVLAELEKNRQQDLLKQAEYWRAVSQATIRKTDRMGIFRWIMTEVVKRKIIILRDHLRLFNDREPLPAGK
jgi:hypothetical protein